MTKEESTICTIKYKMEKNKKQTKNLGMAENPEERVEHYRASFISGTWQTVRLRVQNELWTVHGVLHAVKGLGGDKDHRKKSLGAW